LLFGSTLCFLGSLLFGGALRFLGSLLFSGALRFLGSLLFGSPLRLLGLLLFGGALGVDCVTARLVCRLASVAAGDRSLGKQYHVSGRSRAGMGGGILCTQHGRGRYRLDHCSGRQDRHRNGGKQSRSQIHIRFLAKRVTTRRVIEEPMGGGFFKAARFSRCDAAQPSFPRINPG
ncbi:MAG: hypothetical protein KUL88_02965, partial [Rhizobium sp.]|nr:hypothetical protein [Rhizobium sp.]